MSALPLVLFLAQIGFPGQGPMPGNYPPGTYPPGTYPPGVGYPGGGTGVPLPGRSKGSGSSGKDRKKEAESVPTETARGIVRKIKAKSFEIEAEDTRHLVIAFTEQVPKPAGLAVREPVEVDFHEDEKGAIFADRISRAEVPVVVPPSDLSGDAIPEFVPEGGPQDRAQGSTHLGENDEPSTTSLPGSKYDADDSGPPKLRRGKPESSVSTATGTTGTVQAASIPRAGATPPPQTSSAPDNPAKPDPSLAAIDKAREFANNFIHGLPNYIVHQQTTRFISEGRSTGWQAQDVVSVEVVWDEGKENYRNLTINSKPSNKPAEESGAWSTGEFGTILADLFSPETQAKWVYRRETRLGPFTASLYDFSVEHRHSHWKIVIASQWVAPAYKGSVWIDKKSGHVLRIEMQAVNLPKAFPEDTAEAAVDYDYVRLGENQYFLPVHAEVLDCQRGTSLCDRNVIEFRNYQKFTGESNIQFDQQQ